MYDGYAESEISANILNDIHCIFIEKEVCVSNTTEDIIDAFRFPPKMVYLAYIAKILKAFLIASFVFEIIDMERKLLCAA